MSVLAVSQVVGLVLAAAAVVVARPPWPSTQLIASAALSGLFVALALGTF